MRKKYKFELIKPIKFELEKPARIILTESDLTAETIEYIKRIDIEGHDSIDNYLAGLHRIALLQRWMDIENRHHDYHLINDAYEEPIEILRVTDGYVELFSDNTTLYYFGNPYEGEVLFHPYQAQPDSIHGYWGTHMSETYAALHKMFSLEYLTEEDMNEIKLLKLTGYGFGIWGDKIFVKEQEYKESELTENAA